MLVAAFGDLDGFVADLSDAIRLDQTDHDALFLRGLILMQQDKDDAALDDFSAAIRLDPTDALAFAYRGFLHAWRKEDDAAIADQTASLTLKRTTFSLVGRADAELHKGDRARALAD